MANLRDYKLTFYVPPQINNVRIINERQVSFKNTSVVKQTVAKRDFFFIILAFVNTYMIIRENRFLMVMFYCKHKRYDTSKTIHRA